MGILAWLPYPRLVKCGGRVAPAWEFRLRDLASLEAFAMGRIGSPLDALQEDADDYPDRLREAYDLAMIWPPAADSPEVSRAVFSNQDGIKLFLTLALRDTPADAIDAIMGEISPQELWAIERVAWGVQEGARMHREVVARIDRHLGLPEFDGRDEGDDHDVVTWERAIGQVVARYGWASPSAVLGLSLSQWRMVRCAGDTPEREDPLPADPDLNDRVCAARLEFFGTEVARFETAMPEVLTGDEKFEAEENFN